jgi:signal peptidase
MRFLKKTILILLDMIIVIVSILIFLALVYVFQTRIQHKSYSNIFGFTAFRVATGSMENTIEVGDIVITKLDTPVNLNDIIVFQENNYFITHRLITILDDELITKGDANNSEDKAIEKKQVIGKVVVIISPARFKIIMTK